ncbi:MAG: 2-oxo acid dehydrogenase subunit E2, partial [Myxococcales bacterium]|nr:2-oxo acid dehydrogenase subunit E2 [Myxococcales bacterium]
MMIGAIRERAVVRDDRIVARKMVTLTVTLDHRFIDGFQAGTLAKLMRELFADPWKLEPGLT